MATLSELRNKYAKQQAPVPKSASGRELGGAGASPAGGIIYTSQIPMAPDSIEIPVGTKVIYDGEKGGTSVGRGGSSPRDGRIPSKPDLVTDPKPNYNFIVELIISDIMNYNGNNPDYISLKKNFTKKGHNGTFYRRAVMNVLNFVKEGAEGVEK